MKILKDLLQRGDVAEIRIRTGPKDRDKMVLYCLALSEEQGNVSIILQDWHETELLRFMNGAAM